jgi:hypothetical protein
MPSKGKIAITCTALICVAGVLWMATTGQRSLATYTYSQFLDQVHSGQVASVIVIGNNSAGVEATCRLKNGKSVRIVTWPRSPTFILWPIRWSPGLGDLPSS